VSLAIKNTNVTMSFNSSLSSYDIYQVVTTVGSGNFLVGDVTVQAKLGTSTVFSQVSAKLHANFTSCPAGNC
jgi:hypothetical protein